jgi:predicted N-formylglutamate amidohydrolase
MGDGRATRIGGGEPVRVTNRNGRGAYVFVCDHASNYIPDEMGTLGLGEADLSATSPGIPARCRSPARSPRRSTRPSSNPASPGSSSTATVRSTRRISSPKSPRPRSFPATHRSAPTERARRIRLAYEPFHAAIEAVLAERSAAGLETRLVSVHSFTPVYKGV